MAVMAPRNVRGLVLVAAAMAAMGQAPRPTTIPGTAQWEVTFHDVEEAAGLADVRAFPQDAFEARIIERAWSTVSLGGALPFLRIARTAGVVRAQRYLFGSRAGLQRQGVQDVAIKCIERVCVAETSIEQRLDWESLVTSVATADPCPPLRPDVVGGCADCLQIWIKTFVDGRYLEQSCQQPAEGTIARQLVELLQHGRF
jgi:hypothetical protein